MTDALSILDRAIARRAARHGACTDVERRRYLNTYLYGNASSKPGRVLYVGVGNGFDAILALHDGLCDRIVGVDPYVESDGSGEEDYKTLRGLIEDQGYGDQLTVERQPIQEYLAAPDGRFDLIICSQVLHHIFWMTERLTRSQRLAEAQALFADLYRAAVPSGRFVIAETSRHGLRPLLCNLELIRTPVDYHAKQDWRDWDRAIRAGGWRQTSLTNYVPYRLRDSEWLRRSRLARVTLCEAYVLAYEKAGSPRGAGKS